MDEEEKDTLDGTMAFALPDPDEESDEEYGHASQDDLPDEGEEYI